MEKEKPVLTSNVQTVLIKVTIPRVIQRNPVAIFESKDGTFREEIPLMGNSRLIAKLDGKNEGWFELKKTSVKILSMEPISEEKFNGEEEKCPLLVKSSEPSSLN